MKLVFQTALVSLPLVILSTACSTIPADAPVEFQQAQSALKSADKANVDRLLPNTVKQADQNLREGAALLKKSRSNKLAESEKNAQLLSAIDKANAARRLADDAIALNGQIKAWDENIDGFKAALKTDDEIATLKAQLADISSNRKLQESEREEALRRLVEDLRFAGPVAYFDTNRSQVADRYSKALDEIARILRNKEAFTVKVVGYADPRGPAQYNEKLGLKRAQAIAHLLSERGVPTERIHVETQGDHMAPSHLQGKRDKLQLERRVDVEINPDLSALSH